MTELIADQGMTPIAISGYRGWIATIKDYQINGAEIQSLRLFDIGQTIEAISVLQLTRRRQDFEGTQVLCLAPVTLLKLLSDPKILTRVQEIAEAEKVSVLVCLGKHNDVGGNFAISKRLPVRRIINE